MTLRVVGAGVGRTGTASLKEALAILLDGPCYHMKDVFGVPEHVPIWAAAAAGRSTDWDALYDGYRAAVDWPTSAFWPELIEAFPDALVLLSTRDSAETWWKSADATIFQAMQPDPSPELADWHQMVIGLMQAKFTPDFLDADAAKRAYDEHNDRVRERVPADRLLEWRPGDGWDPICERLGLDVPAVPFPHTNSTAEFQERSRGDT